MSFEEEIGQILKEKGLTIATAESCTGGLVSSRLTDVSGSSEYIKLNFVTYANEAKNSVLGVGLDILNTKGAVSKECAFAMVEGLEKVTGCDVALSTTGIAGPTGGTESKPVGLMFTAVKFNGIVTVKEIRISNNINRIEMKQKFSDEALKLVLSVLQDNRIS